jgi:CspA family cold shock protein
MLVGGNTAEILSGELGEMAEGVIKRLTDKGFGFISTGGDKDIFFHMSDLEGVRYEELQEGQRVSFNFHRSRFGL